MQDTSLHAGHQDYWTFEGQSLQQSFEMAKEILRRMYAELEESVDAKPISGKLFSSHLIDMPEKEQITSAVTTNEGIRILLDHLYKTATKSSLLQFAAILLKDKHTRISRLGKGLKQALQRLQENSSAATGMDRLQNYEELHASAGSKLQSSDISEEKSADNESNTGNKQDEVSGFTDPDYVSESDDDPSVVEATPCTAPERPRARKLSFYKTPQRPRIEDSDSDDNMYDQDKQDQDGSVEKVSTITLPAKRGSAVCDVVQKKKVCKATKTWVDEAWKVLSELMDPNLEFAVHFIKPVDLDDHPDYTDFIAHPLCLKGMEESLLKGKYRTGDAFFEDFKQIIANSRIYNANKKSEIIKCTDDFEMYIHKREKLFWTAIADHPRQLRNAKFYCM